MPKISNYPAAQLQQVPAEKIKAMVANMQELRQLPKPQNDDEFAKRIDEYFQFCQTTGTRPGIEGLCVALNCGRTSLWEWQRGLKCSPKRQEIVCAATQFITGILEQMALSDSLNPPVGIFLMKNWAGYRDNFSLEAISNNADFTPQITREEIARRAEMYDDLPESVDQLPD